MKKGTKLFIAAMVWVLPALGDFEIETASSKPYFEKYVREVLQLLENSKNGNLKKLFTTAKNSPLKITITPITDDPATWHEDGSKTRSYAKSDGKKTWKNGKFIALPARIYLYSPESYQKEIQKGTLAHELVHAIDITYGYYDKESPIRERRAVFFQNIFRAERGYKLRDDYHDRFPTLDYQNAKAANRTDQVAEHILTQPGLP